MAAASGSRAGERAARVWRHSSVFVLVDCARNVRASMGRRAESELRLSRHFACVLVCPVSEAAAAA